ncbi:MAG: hypothetical protein IPL59_23755 [Candidatus Competibacteraceae bacterium]|nr:hypothetical protein [Candidatus Competibacteraceae bacterium]
MNAPSQEQIRETILRTLSEVVPDANAQTLNPDISFMIKSNWIRLIFG